MDPLKTPGRSFSYLPWDNNSWEIAAQIARRNGNSTVLGTAGLTMPVMGLSEEPSSEAASSEEAPKLIAPQLLMQMIVRGARTSEGTLVKAVTVPWFEIIELLNRDPNAAFQIPPDKWEEIIAGAYSRAGFEEVTLTPRSGDYGRDVIAIKKGLGEVRVIDQVKAYKPDHLVTAKDVQALIGALQGDGASKGFLTTTSGFAPKIKSNPLITPFIPSRLELIDGAMLITRLDALARGGPSGDF